MKVTFEFDTESETFDNYELKRHYKANDMAMCLYEITNKLRGWYKYDERGSIPIDEVHKEIWEIIEDHVNLEELGY